MPRFIAIDPSSTFTGWAVFQDQALVAWGNIDARKAEYAGRFQYIIDELTAACLRYGVREVAIEDVKFAWHSKNRYRNIAGLQIVFRSIKEWANTVNLPLTAYNPATWKNAVVGSFALRMVTGTTKEKTKENILWRFPNLPDNLAEHVYDAIAIGVYHGGLRYLEALVK